MLNQVIKLTSKCGFHARPASMFTKLASTFKSQVTLNYNGKKINGKSIINILTLGAACGSEVELVVDGEDESEALPALSQFLIEME